MKTLSIKPISLTFLLVSFIVSLQAQTFFKNNDYPLSERYTTVTAQQAQEAFEFVQKSEILDYGYTRGGCDYRAHAVYLLLKKQGINTFKIWHFAASKLFIAGDFRLLMVKDKMDLATNLPVYRNCSNTKIGNNITWGYHVAPILLVKKELGIDTLVVDPALSNSLIHFKDWMRLQIQEGSNTYYTLMDGKMISFQTESQYKTSDTVKCKSCGGNDIITGLFFSDELSIQNEWIEQSISKDRVFSEYYKKEILPLVKKLNEYPVSTTEPLAFQLACQLAEMKFNIANLPQDDKSKENGLSNLPEEYQEKFKKYIKQATAELFIQ